MRTILRSLWTIWSKKDEERKQGVSSWWLLLVLIESSPVIESRLASGINWNTYQNSQVDVRDIPSKDLTGFCFTLYIGTSGGLVLSVLILSWLVLENGTRCPDIIVVSEWLDLNGDGGIDISEMQGVTRGEQGLISERLLLN